MSAAKEARCSNCLYVHTLQNAEGVQRSVCVRNPPIPMLIPVRAPSLLPNQQVLSMEGVHPPTPASQYCGEWQEDTQTPDLKLVS